MKVGGDVTIFRFYIIIYIYICANLSGDLWQAGRRERERKRERKRGRDRAKDRETKRERKRMKFLKIIFEYDSIFHYNIMRLQDRMGIGRRKFAVFGTVLFVLMIGGAMDNKWKRGLYIMYSKANALYS